MKPDPMKPKVYLETTIPSYLAARPSRDLLVAAHQQITRDWWESRRSGFDLFVSELVVTEARAGDAQFANRRLELLIDLPVLPFSPEILELAEDLITKGPIPRKAAGDAAHIAIATVYGCQYLLTWNCRHIANAELYHAIRRVVGQYGYEVPGLCTPEELMGEEEALKWKDEIVEEVRKAGEAYAARFDYDLARMFEDLKKKEEQDPRPRADLKPLAPRQP